MKQSELIRSITRWRKSWLKCVSDDDGSRHPETLRWGPVYWLLLHLRYPNTHGGFELEEIKSLTIQLSTNLDLAQEFQKFFEAYGSWLLESLTPIQAQTEPQTLLDALYEASIGRDELAQLEPGTFNVERKSRGAFYTPDTLATWSVERASPAFRPDLKVVDPACGSGVFLAAVVKHFVTQGHLKSLKERAEFIENQLWGFDLDKDALLVTRLRLSLEHWVESGVLLKPNLSQKDTLERTNGNDQHFDWIVGNPPWDKLIFQEREFFGALDPAVFNLKTARERRPIYDKLLESSEIRAEWQKKKDSHQKYLERIRSKYPRLAGAKGHLDKYLVFLEWGLKHLRELGTLTFILPNAFYGTTSAEKTREELLRSGWLSKFFGLSNAEKIFDASPGLRFCVIEVQKNTARPQTHIATIFSNSFSRIEDQEVVEIPIRSLLEDGCRFPELYNGMELDRWKQMKRSNVRVADFLTSTNVSFYQELNMTLDSPRFETWMNYSKEFGELGDPRLEPLRSRFRERGYLVVHEKGTFSSYQAWLKDAPRYVCTNASLIKPSSTIRPRPTVSGLSRHWRLALRATIHASESRKVVAALLPPGSVVGNSALTESRPSTVSWADRLLLLGLLNTDWVNWYASKYVATNLNQHILESLPLPILSEERKRVISICALGITMKQIPQEEIIEELPTDWVQEFERSSLAECSAEELEEHVNRLVEDAFSDEKYS